MLRKTALTAALMAVGLLAFQPASLRAEDAPAKDLGDVVSDLLRGGFGEGETDRRVPFSRDEMQLSFAPLVARAGPAVVNVYATQQQVRSPFAGDPFFERFFGGGMPRGEQASSLGSGVLVDETGLVVTNFHVIRDADAVKVALSDGREFTSAVLLKDESLDLAVLKIEGSEPFPVMPIGDSDALQVGDLVLAIGNPFGVGQTTTSGIVSALARSHLGISDFGFFIQTDAAINPGNSGGALVNMAGEVVGINTAIYSQSGGSIGIGFAIPSNMVRAFVDAAKGGADYFERPYLGASFDPVTPQIAEALGIARPAGAIVTEVDPEGPAARAGMKPGDVLLTMNGGAIEHPDALGYRLATQAIGANAAFTLFRRGEEVAVDVVLERAPEGSSAEQVTIGGRSPFAGAKVAALSPRLAQRLRMSANAKGVAIVDVPANSAAGSFGFLPGDIVREVNGVEIDSAAQLADVAGKDTRWWRFTVERQGQTIRQVLRY
jgi:Do/DeqQ family serine protease